MSEPGSEKQVSLRPIRIRFITSTPLNVEQGSGTFVGITCLADALRQLGAQVELVTPTWRLPIYTLQRLLFNWTLGARLTEDCDITVGFDMDGYRIGRKHVGVHVAALKGVIADEMRFERGLTRATMRVQAACERLHVQRADAVMTTSRYAAGRIRELYGLGEEPGIVPELIDLKAWEALLAENPAARAEGKFRVLCVCRFYPRKRLDVLLRAAGLLRPRIPMLELRMVGGGPEERKLRALARDLELEGTVVWLGSVSRAELAREYNGCQMFCLPSVQEGFGLVFLEAMASGKPIVAARAAAVPEVVKHGILVEPDSAAALAEGIEQLYASPELCSELGAKGIEYVKTFDAPVVAGTFLQELKRVLAEGYAHRSG